MCSICERAGQRAGPGKMLATGGGSALDGADDSVSVYSAYSTASSIAPGKARRPKKKKQPASGIKASKEPLKPPFTSLVVRVFACGRVRYATSSRVPCTDAASTAAARIHPLIITTTCCKRVQLHNGLSQLGKTADGLRSAYLRLEVRGTSMANVDELVGLPDLQTLVLPDNDLVDLSKLQHLPSLTSLDVQGNQLTQVRLVQAGVEHLLTHCVSV